MKMFAIKDSKAEAFLQPFFTPTIGTAIRSFQQAVNQEGSDFQKYSADYTLFELADFDERKGEVVPLQAPKNVMNGLDVKDQTIQGGE